MSLQQQKDPNTVSHLLTQNQDVQGKVHSPIREKKLTNFVNFPRFLRRFLLQQVRFQKTFPGIPRSVRVLHGNPESRLGSLLELEIVKG